MEILPAKEFDNPWTQLAIKFPTIADNILDFMPMSDILEFSLVNTFWRKLCRRFLRVKKHLRIYVGQVVCTKFEKLNSILEGAEDLPFIGLHVKLPASPKNCTCQNINNDMEEFEALYPFLFKNLPLQYLSIDFTEVQNCIGKKILRKLLSASVPKNTEHLHLINWPKQLPSLWDYIGLPTKNENQDSHAINQENWLKKLKILHLGFKMEDRHEKEILVWEIVNSAPKLKHIHGLTPRTMLHQVGTRLLNRRWLRPNRYPQLQTNKFRLIRWVNIVEPFEICSLAKNQSNLDCLALHASVITHWQSERQKKQIYDSLTTLMASSSKRLQILDVYFAPHLLPYVVNTRSGPLLRLHRLILHFSFSHGNFDDALIHLKTIDYAKFLPNLSLVFVSSSNCRIAAPEHKISDRKKLLETAKFKCWSVSRLDILCWNYEEENDLGDRIRTFSALADIFPAVKFFNTYENGDNPEYWKHVGLLWDQSLESVSCFFNMNNLKFKCMLRFLTELLENLCCNISYKELGRAMYQCENKFESWSFAPSRLPFCEEFGISTIVVYPRYHQLRCGEFDYIDMHWKTRFDRISAWISAKLPKFSLRFEYDPCGDHCQAVPRQIGLTRSYSLTTDPLHMLHYKTARVLEFKTFELHY